MRAMVLRRVGPLSEHPDPLTLEDVPLPAPKAGEVRVRVQACGVCHTELDEIEGRATPPSLPRIPGHQAIGIVEAVGPGAPPELSGARVGVAWIFRACGACEACRSGHENLCPFFEGTGLDADGGYAEYMVAPSAFVYPIPDALDSVAAAPLLCAGAIGYR